MPFCSSESACLRVCKFVHTDKKQTRKWGKIGVTLLICPQRRTFYFALKIEQYYSLKSTLKCTSQRAKYDQKKRKRKMECIACAM